MDLELKNIWNGAGYRDIAMTLVDPQTKREHHLRIPAKDMQRLINACADAVKQIGAPHPPIDWAHYPHTIYWPQVTPWKAGEPAQKLTGLTRAEVIAEGVARGANTEELARRVDALPRRGGPTVTDPNRPYCKPDQSCCDFTCGN